MQSAPIAGQSVLPPRNTPRLTAPALIPAAKTLIAGAVSAAVAASRGAEATRQPSVAEPRKAHTAGLLAKKRVRGSGSQPIEVAQLPEALLKLETASAIAGISIPTIYRKVAAGTFPALVKMGSRCSRVRAGDLMAWLAAQ